ncbi:ABC transporter permease [Salibaculum halophilum]|uniref:ABC transporter permease n=1 Tax=Salibaculum halophilum TaxID=1914408 RepID=UPI00117A0FB4|nr:ABC transporter permease [Salibaculum halophilum]
MMIRVITRRILRALLTLFLVVTFVFFVLRLTGDPVSAMMPDDTDPAIMDQMREDWGLNRPLAVQYADYWMGLAQGDFGNAYRDGRPALEVVSERIPATLTLTLTGFAFIVIVGFPLGILAAINRGTVIDRGIMTLSVTGFSLPNFFLGILLILLFSVQLRLLPAFGSDKWYNLLMPVFTLGTAGAAVIARFVRSSMLEVLSAPYIRAARARGVQERQIIWRIALPNAAIPTITVLGFMVGALISGSIVTESVFAWPGIGRLLIDSVTQRELAIVQTIVMLTAFSMVVANLTVDLLYLMIDPRQRYAATSGA